MELIFEGKPAKSFCFSLVFSVGWRNEPPHLKNSLSKMLEELTNSVKEKIPEYFEVSRHVDAEFSEIRVWGTSNEASVLLDAVQNVLLPHQTLLELGGGVSFAAAAGAIKSDVLREIEKMKTPKAPKNPKLYVKPRNFFKTFELSRIEELFLYHLLKETSREIYLELSPFGDRIHYGKNFRLPPLRSIPENKKRFEALVARKVETTCGTVDFLVKLNIFRRERVLIRDFFEKVQDIDLLKKLDVIEKMFRRVLS
ncbi:hypothetical protein [Thermotoga sp.]|uniref:hypothetical protein n=1 Tax=Thermotoga sp. TaxID=28240 RepID=UPI0025F2ECD3|nr:hypothetical protein [Thermotoga sp.]MCD6551339.1 hypothetical protein [Thermotoga sp.]